MIFAFAESQSSSTAPSAAPPSRSCGYRLAYKCVQGAHQRIDVGRLVKKRNDN
jgi:hypothetical protein